MDPVRGEADDRSDAADARAPAPAQPEGPVPDEETTGESAAPDAPLEPHGDASADLPPAAPAEPSSAGEHLRAAREAKGLELSHVAAETRIPIRHLESIETGAYDALPSRTYAIGFSKNYARAVGLDREEIADLVRAELASDHHGRANDRRAMEPGDPAKLPSTRLAWFGGLAALLLAVGGVAFYNTYFGAGTGPAPLTAPDDPAGEDLSAGAAAVASRDDGSEAGAAPPADGQVVFTAAGDGVWVRFYEEDGERLFEDTLERGETFEVPQGAEAPLLNTGRPDLLAITIDGQSVPPLAEEPVTLGDVAVSAEALLARSDTRADPPTGD